MGVLNVTPDSFSDGGRYERLEEAVARGAELAAQGAHVIDVGGESTRPGAEPVPVDEEQRRVLGVIEALTAQGIDVSVDTIHAATAEAAVAAGARYINDVSGGTHDPAMLGVAAAAARERGVRFIAGHWRGVPDPAHGRSDYADVVAEVREELAQRARAALAAGIDRSRLVLDPGLGFDKTGAQCWELLARLDELTGLGYPVLIGASRKRMIADALDGLPAASRATAPGASGHPRDLATSVTSALAAGAGAWGVRVHDVAGTVQALAIGRAFQSARVHDGGGEDGAPPEAPAPDRITLTGLEVFAHHGVFDFEREQGQRFLVDAELAVELRAAAAGDQLSRTVHYGELAEAIVAAVRRDPVDLIETVAERVAQLALGFAGVRRATITVHKPDAPIPAAFGDVSVTVVREAPDPRPAGRTEPPRRGDRRES
ncbi:dihydroneopterin aldolase [Leucobacter massiliensis]|uniref:7,8-dihydroneopterin aldolase n=2 Tax=Leucobacter massiliensis TaxID=1686285 RepID=A0A2S9QSP1_9MICO|nr:dihydroneopterin aldolase [Leucobacter massiliensis]